MNTKTAIRLHKLKAEGKSSSEIARILDVDRAIVSWHLALRAKYDMDTIKQLKLHKPLVLTDPMPAYDAAALLPGWPARDKLHKLIRAGILRTKLQKPRAHWTTHAAIRRAALAMLPAGLWVSSDTLPHYCEHPNQIAIECVSARLCYWPVTRTEYFRMLDVKKTARALGVSLEIPSAIKHRAVQALRIAGVATI